MFGRSGNVPYLCCVNSVKHLKFNIMSTITNKKLAKSNRINFVILNICLIPFLTISPFVWLINGFSVNDYFHKIESAKWLAKYHQRAYYERGW